MTIDHSEFITTPVPMVQFALNLQGGAGLPNVDDAREVIILAERLSTGTQTVETVSTGYITSGDEADDVAGAGSPAAIMARRYLNYYNGKTGRPKAPLRIAVTAESSGGTAAVQTLTFATSSNAAGTWKFRVGSAIVEFTAASGDSVSVQAAAFCSAYDALSWDVKPPIGVSPSSGVVTLTAKVKGAHINTIALETLVDPGIGTTDAWSGTTMGAVGGTPGSGEPTLTTVLAAIASTPGAIVVPWNVDATLETLITHVNTKSSATSKLKSRLICALDDAHADLLTWGAGIDDSSDSQRVTACGIENSGTWSGEMAAIYAGMRASERHLARSLDGLQLPGIYPPSAADRFTAAEQKTLLEAGVTPLATAPNGTIVCCVRDMSCRTDLGEMDGALMDVLDYAREYIGGLISAGIDRASILADEYEAPGGVSHITQPKFIRALIRSGMKQLEQMGYFYGVDESWGQVQTELSGTTITIAFPAQMVPQLHGVKVRADAQV